MSMRRNREFKTLLSRSHQFSTSSSSSPHTLHGLHHPSDATFSHNTPTTPTPTPDHHHLSQDYAFLRNTLLSSTPQPTLSSGEFPNDDVVLISNAIKTGLDIQKNQIFRHFRGRLNESLVVQVMDNVKNHDLCVKFFLWAGRQIGYTHTPLVFDKLLELLGCNGNGNANGNGNDRVPLKFLMEIRDDDRELLRRLLNFLVRKCCRNGWWNMALEELGRLKDFGYKPSQTTYNALVQVFLRADKLDTAYLVKKEMLNYGYVMDRYTLSCFAYSLCKAGKCRDALDLIGVEEFVPDTVFYNRMISGLCEASLFEEAMDILHTMRSSSCIPNVVTYRILLSGCLRKGQLGRCKRILSMMITEGCYPNRVMFNSLVHAYCKSRDYSYAYKLFKKMIKCGCHPGYLVYNIFIGSICSNEEQPSSDILELAEKAYSEMLDSGVVLNKINVSNLARCLCGAGKFDQTFKIICEMMGKGFVPDDSTYSKVIGFLCDASKVEKAFLLFGEMKRNGIVPSVYTYTILIDSFCKAGLIQQARKWFGEMLSEGCTPNVVTYTALIHAYLKARKVSDADELFEMMSLEGCKPNVVTYTALIDGHCKAGQIEKACQIYARMRGDIDSSDMDKYFKLDHNNCVGPNVITYGALVDGLCKANRVKEARELLDTMSAHGCEPNQIVYDAVIDGLCKIGKLQDAQEVFAKMSERGYSPNLYTYSSLIDCLFKDNRLDLVLKVLSKMLENSCTPNVVIYTEMVDGLCKVGKTDEAYKLMLKMEEKGCNPNVVTYTAMIDGFGKLGKIEQCIELFRDMCSKGCAPNFITYRVLINHCCSSGFLDEAYILLDEMKQTYWPKHILSHRKRLRDKVKVLKDFQVSCSKRTATALSLKKDPCVQLISSKKSVATNKSKSHNKKVSAMCYGPDENSHVANYKMVLERFPHSLDRKKWSNKERENLSKGIKQQFQETVLQISVDRMSSGCSPGDANDMDSIIESVKGIEITPARIREFLTKVNWDRLASMYVAGRTGVECESRWLNCEDPLINHGPWTFEEDRSLLSIVQEKGIRNWFDIAVSLATNRIPFQCLARFQRSLNSSMINSEWTEEEDAQLCSAVAYFGDSNWQNVASVLERRTGTQCSNRWKKSIFPVRKGSFTLEEDERLTVAVMLFGRKWNQIAKYVPGRIQSQCRDRYVNSLDPSLKWGGWTEEEDLRLEAAITKYGYCWSKVAEDVPPRTDSQCRKRWKVICPEQVPLLQEARKRRRSLLARNFVDRESERPALTLNDFIPLQMVVSTSDVGAENLQRKRKRQTRGVPKKVKSKKHTKRTQLCTEEVQDAGLREERPKRHAKKGSFYPEVVQNIVPKKEKPKRHSKKARICPDEDSITLACFLQNISKKKLSKCTKNAISCCDKVKPCINSLETQDGDSITLACFLHNKSKKKLSKCTKNASQASSSSKTKTVSKQVENQISCGEQHRLSLSCDIDGTKDLLMQAEVDSSRQVRKLESANAARKPDMPLKFYVRKKKKLSQATLGSGACSPSKLKKGSTLLHGNKSIIISDGSEPSMSKIVEDETVLHGGVAEAEPTTINVAEEYAVLHGGVPEGEPTIVNVVEKETVLHGGVADAKPTNIYLEENDDLLISFLQNKTKKQRRRINIRK